VANTTRMSRLEAGAVIDEVEVPGVGTVPVRVRRCPAGWQVTFEVRDVTTSEITVTHKLVAPTFREAKAAVPQAVAFLLGRSVDAPVQNV
jgi:hypothetical protein